MYAVQPDLRLFLFLALLQSHDYTASEALTYIHAFLAIYDGKP